MAIDRKTITVPDEASDMRLDRYLRECFTGLKQGAIEKMLRKVDIRLNEGKVKSSQRLNSGDVLLYPAFIENLEEEENIPVREEFVLTNADKKLLKELVLFEDEDIIVINKPSGLASQGGTGVTRSVDRLLKQAYEEAPRLTHRLDKDTSGVLVLAKSRKAAQFLTSAFADKTIQKVYVAHVKGQVSEDQGIITLPLTKAMVGQSEKVRVDMDNGLAAESHYTVLERRGNMTVLELRPRTGRTHQLRVHCSEGLNAPILGDRKYGGSDAGRGRLMLHALSITFDHPKTHEPLTINAPLPDDSFSSDSVDNKNEK